MRIQAVPGLLCLLLTGMAQPPPYVNPLTAEQLEGLRISEIRIEHLQDGSIDAEKAAKAAAWVRARLVELLKGKLAPGNGNAVLVVKLELLFLKDRSWFKTGPVQLRLAAKLEGAGSPPNTPPPATCRPSSRQARGGRWRSRGSGFPRRRAVPPIIWLSESCAAPCRP